MWISVEDRLPKEHMHVLLHTTDGNIFLGYLEGAYFCDYLDWFDYTNEDVTHWMPLPESPESINEMD